MVDRQGPSPDDFEEQLDRYRELMSVEHRLLLVGADGEGTHLRRRRTELLNAIHQWDLRFLGGGDGDGGAY